MISFNSKVVNTVYLNNANNLLNFYDMLLVDSDSVVLKILLYLALYQRPKATFPFNQYVKLYFLTRSVQFSQKNKVGLI